MDSADVTSLTTAFEPGQFLATFLLMAPFIVSVVGLIIGIAVLKWGVRKARTTLSKPSA